MSQPPVTNGPDVCCNPCDELPRVAQARRLLLTQPVLEEMTTIFRILGDPLRLHLIHLLAHQELCVCDLMELLGAGQSTISNHLRVLRAHKLVRTRKEGKLIFYSLNAPDLACVVQCEVERASKLEAIA